MRSYGQSGAPSTSVAERLQDFARTRDPSLRAQLIEEHLGLVERLARRYAGRGIPLDDLVQCGSIGLINNRLHSFPRSSQHYLSPQLLRDLQFTEPKSGVNRHFNYPLAISVLYFFS